VIFAAVALSCVIVAVEAVIARLLDTVPKVEKLALLATIEPVPVIVGLAIVALFSVAPVIVKLPA
jgi:hypothetical protein